jgi:RNA polymerase sigma-70 factor (ECF subfamily)
VTAGLPSIAALVGGEGAVLSAPGAWTRPASDASRTAMTHGAREVADADSLERRALRGDAAAWDALIARHNARVVLTLLARGVRPDRAKDLAQDAWLRLIEQQRKGLLRELVLPGLAVAQAAFLAREDARRKSSAQAAALDDEGAEAHPADLGASAEQRLLTSERLARAAQALATCSPTAQRVFRLVYEHPELPHAAVAAQVGLSLQRVRQIVCEVRKVLREAIDADDDRHV